MGEVRAREEGVTRHVTSPHRHHSSEARRGLGTGLGRGVGHGPGPGKRGGARAWEEGGEGEAARGVARGAARPWLHRGTEAAWQA